ncbi:hypothetical protein J6590_043636 [Homalodisca vitripennis]|nr:hypothetical protein J6590_043636 [Homalodisca vitripennis]
MGNQKKNGSAIRLSMPGTTEVTDPGTTESKSSISKSKLQPKLGKYSTNDSLEYEIVDLAQLKGAIDEVAVCKSCHGTLSFSKKTAVGLASEFVGVYEAVLSYNDGCFSKVKMIKELGLSTGVNLAKAMKRLDEERIRKAEKALLEFEKKCGNQEL